MRWTERQRAMLREMGIPLWAPAAAPVPDSVEASRSGAAALLLDATPSRVDPGEAGARAADSRAGGAAVVAPSRRGAFADAPVRADVGRGAVADDALRLPGLAPADWLVVAEPLDGADPRQEQLLDNMLRAIGVGLLAPNRERRAVFSPLLIASSSAGAADALRAANESALATAIDAVAPRCILAFGRAAAATLLGDDAPIGGLRGRVHPRGGVPVVVTFSLPFLLRHPAEKAKAWADLCLAMATVSASAAG